MLEDRAARKSIETTVNQVRAKNQKTKIERLVNAMTTKRDEREIKAVRRLIAVKLTKRLCGGENIKKGTLELEEQSKKLRSKVA